MRIIFFLFVVMILGLLAGIALVDAQPSSICDTPAPDALYVLPSRQAVWDVINAGLLMHPRELKLKPVQWTYTNPTQTAALFEMFSQPAQQKWIFVYPLLDPPGQRQTPRDFCVVWIYDLANP